MINESTDISTTENLIVYVKLVNDFKPETHFLFNIKIPNGRADTVTQTEKNHLAAGGVETKKRLVLAVMVQPRSLARQMVLQ